MRRDQVRPAAQGAKEGLPLSWRLAAVGIIQGHHLDPRWGRDCPKVEMPPPSCWRDGRKLRGYVMGQPGSPWSPLERAGARAPWSTPYSSWRPLQGGPGACLGRPDNPELPRGMASESTFSHSRQGCRPARGAPQCARFLQPWLFRTPQMSFSSRPASQKRILQPQFQPRRRPAQARPTRRVQEGTRPQEFRRWSVPTLARWNLRCAHDSRSNGAQGVPPGEQGPSEIPITGFETGRGAVLALLGPRAPGALSHACWLPAKASPPAVHAFLG